jgi:hypothetical protein
MSIKKHADVLAQILARSDAASVEAAKILAAWQRASDSRDEQSWFDALITQQLQPSHGSRYQARFRLSTIRVLGSCAISVDTAVKIAVGLSVPVKADEKLGDRFKTLQSILRSLPKDIRSTFFPPLAKCWNRKDMSQASPNDTLLLVETLLVAAGPRSESPWTKELDLIVKLITAKRIGYWGCYELALRLMCGGFFALAGKMLPVVLPHLANHSLAAWIETLVDVCRAESPLEATDRISVRDLEFALAQLRLARMKAQVRDPLLDARTVYRQY